MPDISERFPTSRAQASRIDKLLVDQGYCRSRNQARELISLGKIMLQVGAGWEAVSKPSQTVLSDARIKVLDNELQEYVSRGGLKLAGAITQVGADFQDKTVLDVGQSTGGFTDCALKQGATLVVGVEVGHGQLTPSLRDHPQVRVFEGINAKEIPLSLLELTSNKAGYDFAVMDLSFISQTLVLKSVAALLVDGGSLISLVKPQFEVGPAGLGKGGIVKNASLYTEVEEKIKMACADAGLRVMDYFPSSITGGDGNREFFVFARKAANS
ncbi:TlyA family RNA methyltransferase [Hahella sp. CR1]|uniref:TlyA family RNA methyltransferase n=1 Tax=Hahella sp. CR1 TaxID=2992807 RepID=UPI0024411882|nr:TlyA family RNA methyltransferase [Hahella sp. CR1]MDG9667957.1 TlyA family RNA methyltransferase [Hahella sp. CR1]